MKSPKRGNMSQFGARMNGELNRERILELISLYPGIVMGDIADRLALTKSTAYPHVAILIGAGRIKPIAFAGKVGKRGSSIGYWPVAAGDEHLETPGRFDYPTQITVPATDKAKLPDACPLMNALFGRNQKETA